MAERQTPDHIAIIMDGNRRWAEAEGRAGHTGHHQGAGILEGIAEAVHDEGVSWLTLFAFSSENWNRSSAEITALMTVFRHYMRTRVDALMERDVRLRVIGDTAGFAPDIVEALDTLVERTAGNSGLNLTVALGYGGKADIAGAMRRIGKQIADGTLDPDSVDEGMVKDHLATAELPPVDLLVRTGREQRVSNFLLWDMAYAELVFSDTLWPDFSVQELRRLIDEYRDRDRRFGGDAPTEGMPAGRRAIGQA